MIPELPGAVPEIPVSDVLAAVEYYRNRMSFSVDWIDGEIGLAGISRDGCRLFIAGPAFRGARGTTSPVTVWLNLSSEADVDALHRTWRATGAVMLSDPESKPWGLHEFTAADPDGNRFRVFYDFATPARSVVTEQAASIACAAILDQARRDRREGRRREALEGYERAAECARSANDSGHLAHALRHVSDLQCELGQHRPAEAAAAEAVALYRRYDGDASLDLANALRLLALAQESLGQFPAAEGSWQEARGLYMMAGVLPGVQECDAHLARLG